MFSKLWILALFWTIYNPGNSVKTVCQLSLHICPKTLPTMHFCFSNRQLQCKWMWSCKHNVQIVATLIYLETLLSMLLSYGVVIFFLVLLNISFRVGYDSVRMLKQLWNFVCFFLKKNLSSLMLYFSFKSAEGSIYCSHSES